MKKLLVIAICAVLLVGVVAAQTKITLWTQEGTAENAFQYVQSLAAAYAKTNSKVTFEVLNKETEALREDFQTAALAGNAPELLWTVSDHAGPFTAADLIQPIDKLVDLTKYADASAVMLDGMTWGVPISSGNHLMLLYNKDLVKTAPKDTDALIKLAAGFNAKGIVTLTFNQTEPFWLVPWLGGYKGRVFAADGKTPTLNTAAMVSTLQLLQDLKFKHKVLPAEADYNTADTMFKEGKAAMIINGDWSLGDYKKVMGDKLGVARIPQVKGGTWPAPYTAGKFFMITKDIEKAKLDAVVAFIKFATNKANQLDMFAKLTRLPALKEAAADKTVTSDPITKASAEQMTVGVGMPSVIEMRANWDAMKPELIKVMA
ncbi:MAG: extracellular solute-binding protein, partial [Spirochaetaceae bacterium]|nr:extracellular solute-binding protein [Spirochaetaceae bacterium]